MEWEIIKDFDNRLMGRRELVIKIDYAGGATPSKAELQAIVAKKFAVEPRRVEIVKIMSEKGYSAGKIWVKIWDEPKVEVLFEEKKPEKDESSEAGKDSEVPEKSEAGEETPVENSEKGDENAEKAAEQEQA